LFADVPPNCILPGHFRRALGRDPLTRVRR
jgi:hypothetical protein